MSAHNINAEDLLFSARLTPYRSLNQQGFRTLMIAIACVCFTIGGVFFALGMWPVLGFMGLDVAVIYWAFKANYKSARAFEDVEISRAHVALRKVSPRGVETSYQFPQFGTRFVVERHEEIGITNMRIANRARSVPLGTFLNPPDRESFAMAFSNALSRAKR